MQSSHRYVRPLSQKASSDRYNSLAGDWTVEYWTNGPITLLELPTMSAAAPAPSNLSNNKNNSRKRIMKPKDSTVRNSLLAGSLAGMASTIAMHPMDVIRTKVQSSQQSVLQALQQTKGLRAFYRGLSFPLAAQALYKATIFAIYNTTVQRLQQGQQNTRNTGIDKAIAGGIAGALNAALWVTPVELIRSQLIIRQTASKISSWQVLQNAVKTRTLWRGLTLTMARDGLGCALFFSTLHTSQLLLGDGRGTGLISGGLAGLSFWLVALPLDSLKTQIQSGPLDQAPKPLQWQNLLRGWPVAYGRGIPAAAITMTVYSTVYEQLN